MQQSPAAGVRVEALATTTTSQPWAQARSFLVDHLPHSWKLLGPLLWLETAHGAPRSPGHRWFVARSPRSEAEGDEVRGVLLVKPRGNGNVVSSPNVSLFVPPRTGPAGEAVVRALLEQVEFVAASGGVHVSGLPQEWLPLVRERAAAAGARESWLLPCLALHCPEARFVPQPDPSAQLFAHSLRLDSISPSNSADTELVVSQWKYSSEERDDYIATCVGHAPSTCIRQGKQTLALCEEMVAWIGVHSYMALGFFWVQESQRRKGLGKVIAAEQTRKAFDYVRPYLKPEHVGAHAFTESVNDASKALLQSLGFEIYGEVVWAAFEPDRKPGTETTAAVTVHEAGSPEKPSTAARALTKVNLAEKLSLFTEHWSPKIVGEVDNFDVKVAKLKGEFVWHHHEHEDELFLVVKGDLVIKVRERDGGERDIDLHEGDFFVVPKGVEHKPIAAEECHVMLLERRGVLNTGNVRSQQTVDNPQRL